MEHETQPGTLIVGSRVHCILYGGKDGAIFAIHGEQSPSSVRQLGDGCMVMGGSAYFDVVWDNGTESNRVPEAIIHGVQWRILPGVATADDLAAMRGFAILEANRRSDEASKAKAEFDAEVARLRTAPEYAHLKQANEPAANIRAQLKRAFPGVKFSVRTEHHGAVNVNWTDGPLTAEVERIANKYRDGHFDGMDDCFYYNETPWNHVFGGINYVSCNRHFSVDTLKEAARSVAEDFGGDLAQVEFDSSGNCLGYVRCDHEQSRLIYDCLERRGFFEHDHAA